MHAETVTDLMQIILTDSSSYPLDIAEGTVVEVEIGSSKYDLALGLSIPQSVHNLTTAQNIPENLEQYIATAVHRLVAEANIVRFRSSTQDVESQRQWIDLYKSRWARFSITKPSFIDAYVHIVSKEPDLYDTLLQLETGYHNSIANVKSEFDQEMKNLQMRYGIDGEDTLNHSYRDERDMLSVTSDSKMDELKRQQKEEYREFVTKVYQEILEKKGRDNPTIVTTAIRGLQKQPSQQILRVDSTNSIDSKESIELDSVTRRQVDDIKSMGFDESLVIAALGITFGNTERAIMLLLENPDKVTDHIQNSQSTPTFAKALSSSSLNRPKEKRDIKSSKLAKSRSFSFSKSVFSSAENLDNNASNPFKNFLGKAMDAFKNDGSVSNINDTEELSESFTVFSGSHVKLMSHLKIHVAPINAYFSSHADPTQKLAAMAQSNSSLYSQSISGIVLLLKPSDFANYGLPSSANKSWLSKCQASADFHFDSVETQLQQISAQLTDDSGALHLAPGIQS